MEKLEKLIYSVKYLPPILYFGSAGLLGYDFYSIVFKEKEFLNVYTETPLIIIFCLMTWWGVNRLQKK
mgnify:FL=1|tara:strand:+ start:66 stop:269 length:204 start_codon:yes stop_codon:yes gene_type:complete